MAEVGIRRLLNFPTIYGPIFIVSLGMDSPGIIGVPNTSDMEFPVRWNLNKSKRFHSRCNFYVLFILMHEPNPTQTTWLLQATQSRHFSIPWKILKCASLYIWVMTRAQWGLRSPNSTINTVQEFSFCPAEIQSELHFFFVNPLLSLFVEAELLFSLFSFQFCPPVHLT